jgi:hypothetical protein
MKMTFRTRYPLPSRPKQEQKGASDNRKKQSNPGSRATLPKSSIVTNTRSNYIANSPTMSSFTSKSCSASTTRHDATSCNGSLEKRPRISLIALEFLLYIQQGKKFTWVHVRLEILTSLTDVTFTARFLALSRLKRKTGSTAKLWISQVMTRRALLEDPRLPTPVMLPETLYLELTVGQISAQETTLFEFPCIGDDLNERDRQGNHRFTLDFLRTTVDQCSNLPAFREVKTPITDLLDQEPSKGSRDIDRKKSTQGTDNKSKLHSRATEKSKTTDAKSVKTVRFDQD